MTVRILASALVAAAVIAGPAAAQDRPTAEACAVVRATLEQQNAAAAPTAKKSGAGRKLLGFAASALANAGPGMFSSEDALKNVAGQAAIEAVRQAAQAPAEGTPAAAAATAGRKGYNGGPDAQALANFGATMGTMGPQGAKAQAQIAAVQATARATNGDTRAVQAEILKQSGC